MSSGRYMAAFPLYVPKNVTDWSEIEEGMMLRDYFAAAALPAIWQTSRAAVYDDEGNVLGEGTHLFELTARAAYLLADAMLKARE